MMTPQRWLSLWETTMLYGLEGCRGVPTVFFSSSNIIPDIKGALATLKGLLEAAGVRGLKMPSDGEIKDRIQRYIFTGEREYKINAGAQARLNLPEIPVTDTTPPTPSHAQVRPHPAPACAGPRRRRCLRPRVSQQHACAQRASRAIPMNSRSVPSPQPTCMARRLS